MIVVSLSVAVNMARLPGGPVRDFALWFGLLDAVAFAVLLFVNVQHGDPAA